MSSQNDNDDAFDEREPGFFRRYGPVLAICLVAAGGIAWWLVSTASGPKPPPPRPQEFSMVRVALPPPPPPPPPPKQEDVPKPEPADQQMIEQEPVPADEPQEKPAESPEPPGEDAAPMGTGIQGDGPPDGFGLTGRGNGGIIGGTGTGAGTGGRGSSRWGWYAAQVQTTVSSALGKNPKTRTSTMDISVRIWPDAAGRIERAQLVSSTGNDEIDAAIRDEVLTGLTLREPPPADMPSPIVLRLSARRP